MSGLKDLRKERGFLQIKTQMLTGTVQSDYSKAEADKLFILSNSVNELSVRLIRVWIVRHIRRIKKPYPRSK